MHPKCLRIYIYFFFFFITGKVSVSHDIDPTDVRSNPNTSTVEGPAYTGDKYQHTNHEVPAMFTDIYLLNTVNKHTLILIL